MASLGARLCGREMDSPLVLASGPLSYGAEAISLAFAAGASAVVTKTIGLHAAVNPTPHIWRAERGSLLNTEKWSDLPPEQWLSCELPALRGHPGLLIVSIGNSVADVEGLTTPLTEAGADLVEVVSYSGDDAAPMVTAAVARTSLPVLVKVSSNWPNLLDVVGACVLAGAAGVTAIDSIGPALRIDVETARPVLESPFGHAWLSGPAIKPLAVRAVADIKRAYGVPVVAVGGVSRGTDVAEMLMAGADAVSAHTAPLLMGLGWFQKTRTELAAFMDAHGYASLPDLQGVALPHLTDGESSARLGFAFDPAVCTECMLCVRLCPYGARNLKARVMTLDDGRCRSCGLCASVCAAGALHLELDT